jgi:hypothetical protein
MPIGYKQAAKRPEKLLDQDFAADASDAGCSVNSSRIMSACSRVSPSLNDVCLEVCCLQLRHL